VLAAGAAGARDELAEILHDIVAQGLRASEVVNGLRELVRVGSPDMLPIDLSVLVREMLPLLRRELEDHRVDLQTSLADGLPPIEGRRVQLGQIVVNLVLNACEALAAVPPPRRIAVETASRDGRVELTVRDNGTGLAPDVADRVFEPFVSTKPNGMGMGLAICRSIAEVHRGRLTAASAPGGGTAMVLSLPASETTVNHPG
jgi:two-component system sensor histidine kinase DctS